MKILAIGHSRCGSGYTAAYLRSIGYDVGHEKMHREGISSWLFVNNVEPDEEPYCPITWDSELRNKQENFDFIIHYVRDPKDALPSILTEQTGNHKHAKCSFEYRRRVLLYYFHIDLAKHTKEDAAAISYIFWNKLAEIQSNIRVRVEHIDEDLPLMKLESLEDPPSKKVNSRFKNPFDFGSLSKDVLSELNKMAERYNYCEIKC